MGCWWILLLLLFDDNNCCDNNRCNKCCKNDFNNCGDPWCEPWSDPCCNNQRCHDDYCCRKQNLKQRLK